MLLQVLRSLERLPAEVTPVWLEWNVDPDVRSDVIPFDSGGTATAPLTLQIEVVCALASNMAITDVFLLLLSVAVEDMERHESREVCGE